jgi:hypothetical protein
MKVSPFVVADLPSHGSFGGLVTCHSRPTAHYGAYFYRANQSLPGTLHSNGPSAGYAPWPSLLLRVLKLRINAATAPSSSLRSAGWAMWPCCPTGAARRTDDVITRERRVRRATPCAAGRIRDPSPIRAAVTDSTAPAVTAHRRALSADALAGVAAPSSAGGSPTTRVLPGPRRRAGAPPPEKPPAKQSKR